MISKTDRSPNVILVYLCSVMGATVTLSVITGWQSWTHGFASLVPMPERLFQFLAVTVVSAFLVGIFMLPIAAVPFLAVYQIAKRWRVGNIAYYLICGAFVG